MNKEIDKLIKMDSLITEIELKKKVVDVILQDQENAYFEINGECKEAYIAAMHDQAATRNYNAVLMIRDSLTKLEELSKLYASIDHKALMS